MNLETLIDDVTSSPAWDRQLELEDTMQIWERDRYQSQLATDGIARPHRY